MFWAQCNNALWKLKILKEGKATYKTELSDKDFQIHSDPKARPLLIMRKYWDTSM